MRLAGRSGELRLCADRDRYHSSYDSQQVARGAQLVVDTRNAMKGIQLAKIVRC
jgi:hypothetical protein